MAIPDYSTIKQSLGISKAEKWYYTPAGKLDLEMRWAEQRYIDAARRIAASGEYDASPESNN